MLDPLMLDTLAGVSSLLGLVAVFGGAYLYFAQRQRERSLLSILQGESIARPGDLLQVLEKMKTDKARLDALSKLLDHDNHDKSRATALLGKVKATIDLERFSQASNRSRHHTLIIVGVALIVLAAIAASWNGDPCVVIRGKVLSPNGTAVDGATVTINGFRFGAVSDRDGVFSGKLCGIKRGQQLDMRALHPLVGREQRTIYANDAVVELMWQLKPVGPAGPE